MIAQLRLQNFRSYRDANFVFSPAVNIIAGPNASGKTNLLEAVLVLAQGKSYRAKDSELITFDEPWGRLDGLADDEQRTIKLTAEPQPSKLYELSGKPFKRLSAHHSLPVVVFEPNHLQLLHGAPDQRRAYLDDLLEQLIPSYAAYRRNYRRVLSHRNTLLKRAHTPSAEELFPWNLRLSELGAVISRARSELCQDINSSLGELYKDISSSNTQTELTYDSQFGLAAYESKLLDKLESNLMIDRQRGYTTAGPHREDFTIRFDGQVAENTASRGETRTAVLALKVFELQRLEQARDQAPLLLLDDVFSELDTARRKALTSQLDRYQTFITTTDADTMAKGLQTANLIVTEAVAQTGSN